MERIPCICSSPIYMVHIVHHADLQGKIQNHNTLSGFHIHVGVTWIEILIWLIIWFHEERVVDMTIS